MITVIATERGFDGLVIRNPGDKFPQPDNVFDVHEKNHKERVKRYEKLLAEGKEAQRPEYRSLWFRKANKEEDSADDLT